MATGYKDYYKILGVDRNASVKDIKAAYRKMARKYHPDVNPGDKSAEERFKEVSEAHEILSDKEKRSKYDQFGQYWNQVGAHGAGGPGPAWENFTFGDAGDFGERMDFGREAPFDRMFESLFGKGARGAARTRRAPQQPAKGRDIESEMEITLEDAFHGTKKAFSLGGRRLEVKIPKGMSDGQRIRLAKQGEEGPAGRGDLYIKVKIRPHPVYERKGDDLLLELPVDYVMAALGGELQVPTISGRVTMKIPPNTRGGRSFRMPGQGMAKLKGGGRGDLYAKVKMQLPEVISDKERQLLEEVRKVRGEP